MIHYSNLFFEMIYKALPEYGLLWVPQNHIFDRSILLKVVDWCPQVKSHKLTNVDPDLCLHMASLGLNGLSEFCDIRLHMFQVKLSLIVPSWRHMASQILAIICSSNGLSPFLHQAIFWSSAYSLSNDTLGHTFQWNLNETEMIFNKIHFKSAKCVLFLLRL